MAKEVRPAPVDPGAKPSADLEAEQAGAVAEARAQHHVDKEAGDEVVARTVE